MDGLQITANSPADAGTWRRSVLLEPGRYRFEGRARIENTSRWNFLMSPTVSMRSSEAGQPRRTDRGEGAVAFAHDFAVESQRRVEFICEIKGGPGRVVTRQAGDCLARLEVLLEQTRVSLDLAEACLDRLIQLKPGPINVRLPKVLKVPEGQIYTATENPLGFNGYYLVSRGEKTPWRLKLRSASFNNVSVLTEMLPGQLISDMVAILGSMFFVVGDVDK